MPKDVVVPDIAEWYRKRGFTALIFDTFGIGSSDGEPRNDVSCPILYIRELGRSSSAKINRRGRATCTGESMTLWTRLRGFPSTLW